MEQYKFSLGGESIVLTVLRGFKSTEVLKNLKRLAAILGVAKQPCDPISWLLSNSNMAAKLFEPTFPK